MTSAQDFGLVVINPRCPDVLKMHNQMFLDRRGHFFEAYREHRLAGLPGNLGGQFVQGNFSYSANKVLRGMHYQVNAPQGKMMRTIHGRTFNVCVDMRAGSPSLHRVTWTVLDTPEHALWVPPGFANGFMALTDDTVVLYECSTYYQQGYDRALRWNSLPEMLWPDSNPILSDKDRDAPRMEEAEQVPEVVWRPLFIARPEAA